MSKFPQSTTDQQKCHYQKFYKQSTPRGNLHLSKYSFFCALACHVCLQFKTWFKKYGLKRFAGHFGLRVRQ